MENHRSWANMFIYLSKNLFQTLLAEKSITPSLLKIRLKSKRFKNYFTHLRKKLFFRWRQHDHVFDWGTQCATCLSCSFSAVALVKALSDNHKYVTIFCINILQQFKHFVAFDFYSWKVYHFYHFFILPLTKYRKKVYQYTSECWAVFIPMFPTCVWKLVLEGFF